MKCALGWTDRLPEIELHDASISNPLPPCTVHQSPQIKPMNDIKTIEELRVYHKRLKGLAMALKRLEKRERKVTQSGTNPSPQFTALHPALRGSHAENKG